MGTDKIEGNYEQIILDLMARVRRLEGAETSAKELSEISPDMGLLEAGEIRVHADPMDPREPGDGFSGVRIVDRFEYPPDSGIYYAIIGASNDSPTFLIASLDGTAKFANLHATLGANGIDIDDFLAYAIRHTFTNDGKERIGKLEPIIVSGSTTPCWALTLSTPAADEMMTNGGFELGDFSNWTKTTETNGAWEIDDAVYQGGAYSAKWVPTAEGDGKTKVLMHFDGVDTSTTMTDVNGRTWTARNHAQLDTAQKVFGTASLLLDGTDDYIDTPDSDDFNVGSGDFEIECRIRPHAVKDQCIFGQSSSAGANSCIDLNLVDDGTYTLAYLPTVGGLQTIQGGWTYEADNWYTLSISRYENTLRFRVNGVAVGSANVTGITLTNSAYKFSIGRLGEYNGLYFNGWIDEFIFVKGTVRHTADYTPAIAAYGEIYTEGVLTSDRVVVTGSTAHLISGYIRGTGIAGTIKAEVKWYDHASAGSLISTDLLGNLLAGGGFELKEQVLTSPSTALSCTIVLTSSSSTTYEINFDTLSISLSTVSQKLWLADDGVYWNGVKIDFPSTALIFAPDFAVTAGTPSFSWTGNTDSFYGGYWISSAASANNGDAISKTFTIKAGTYTIRSRGASSTNRGKLDYYIDDVLVSSGQDWYSGSATANVTKTIASIVITGGEHTLKLVVNGKNGSSTDYCIGLTCIDFY